MPRLDFSPRAVEDLKRFQVFLLDMGYPHVQKVIALIVAALNELKKMPLLGRTLIDHEDLRELIIPFSNSGYIALYQYLPEHDLVRILAIKHQKENNYN
jgi:plasmid stabilization system protein ParE